MPSTSRTTWNQPPKHSADSTRHRLTGEAVAKNRYAGLGGKAARRKGLLWSECSCVTTMAVTPSGGTANGGEALASPAGAETGVDEDAGFAGFEMRAIAGGTASQNR